MFVSLPCPTQFPFPQKIETKSPNFPDLFQIPSFPVHVRTQFDCIVVTVKKPDFYF